METFMTNTNIRQFYLSELFISAKTSWWQKPKAEIVELARRIQRDGLLNPLLIRESEGKYEILDGEKRFKALKYLVREKSLPRNLNKIPCYFEGIGINHQTNMAYKPTLLTDSDFTTRVISMFERGHSKNEIEVYFQCSTAAVNDALSVRKLHVNVKTIFDQGHITLAQASAFATLPYAQSQYQLLLQLGPFATAENIIAAIKEGDTVLNLPDGNVLILPSRSAQPSVSNMDIDSAYKSLELAA